MNFIANLQLHKNHFLLKYRMNGMHPGSFHAHQGMEFLYVYRGTGTFMLDNRLFELKDGTLIYFQPFQLHRIQPDRSLEYIRSYAVFEPSLFEPYLTPFPMIRKFFHHLWKDQLPQQMFYDLDDKHPIVLSFQELHRKSRMTPAGQMNEEFALFILSLLQWLRPLWSLSDLAKSVHVRPLTHVERMMAWLEDHYREPFSIDPLSRHVHLSPKHISTLFRQQTGGTITDYLMTKRLSQACLLLKTTTDPIGRIAIESGFGNVSYFTEQFKKKLGVTPKDYRKCFLELL